MAIVQTRALTTVFRQGAAGAVVDVDLESREGEFLVLLGPSGSGKTTLLRMIAGLEEPTSGRVLAWDRETREGEFRVLLGPSGSGKTTLLRMIAGLEEPTSGQILIGGEVVNDLTPRERRIAMVFQSYALYPHLTVLGNIVFPLKAQRVARPEREKKAQWAADLLGLGQLL